MAEIKDDVSGLRLLGGGSMPAPRAPDKSLLETFPNRFQGRIYLISIVFPEYTSLCPVTGQPDFGTISVEYVPDRLCVESKSFKLYMFAWRNERTFMETVTNSILSDLVTVLNPCWCRVKGLFAPRGATRLHVFAEEYKPMEPEREASVRAFVRDWLIQPSPDYTA